MYKKIEESYYEFLEGLNIKGSQYKKGLTLFPVYGEVKSSYYYLTLDEAIKKDILIIKEGAMEMVSRIEVINKGKDNVFIMEGEELVGCKQNRVVNVSLIIPGETKVNIPVSCVEEGRWHYVSHKFRGGGNISFCELRIIQKSSVMENLEKRKSYDTDQDGMWEVIEKRLKDMKVPSASGAMKDIYEKREREFKKFSEVFIPMNKQIGGIFCINGDVVGMDVFDKPATWKKLMPKILKSYFLEVSFLNKKKRTLKKKADEFLKGILKANFSFYPVPGKGKSVIIKGNNVIGTSLLVSNTVIHTSVFKKFKTYEGEDISYITSPFKRRFNRL